MKHLPTEIEKIRLLECAIKKVGNNKDLDKLKKYKKKLLKYILKQCDTLYSC